MSEQIIRINDQAYRLADLNDTARSMLRNIQIAERKIEQLQQEMALIRIARESFGPTLLANLPAAVTPEAPAAKKPSKKKS